VKNRFDSAILTKIPRMEKKKGLGRRQTTKCGAKRQAFPVQEWQNAIFSNQNNPDKGVETCCNLICLSPDAHEYWRKSYFALQPIELSADKKRLDVKLHWVPRRRNCTDVDILSPPPIIGRFRSYSATSLSNRSTNLLWRPVFPYN
jgi:hypothetical protein